MKEHYKELFELQQEERVLLERFIATPPQDSVGLHDLELLISRITHRVAPLYNKGQGMAHDDLTLIDRATGVLAEVEEHLKESEKSVDAAKGNLHFLYSGTGTLH